MTTVQDTLLKAFSPRMVLKLSSLGNSAGSKEILNICNRVLMRKYNTLIDVSKGVIYIGKRI